MRMPFKHQVQPPSRMERLRCGVQSRAADAAQGARVVVDRARPMAADAAAAAQAAAVTVSEAASSAAQTVAERARPLADEAATRGSAAWTVLRYGVPAPSPISRVVALVPVVGKAGSAMKSKTGSAVTLMALGGAAAAGVMWWRRSRSGADSVWILDETDSDVEPPEGWHEGSMSSARAGDRRNAADRLADRASDLADSEPRKRPDTWP